MASGVVLAAGQPLTELRFRELAPGEHLERGEIGVVGHDTQSM